MLKQIYPTAKHCQEKWIHMKENSTEIMNFKHNIDEMWI